MRRKMRVAAAVLGTVVVMSGIGCVGPRITQPMRAVWVTRFDYKTESDVTKIVDDCADAGFNAILFQVRGNGTAFYDSNLEPWAVELGGEDPGFDPLALAIERAHEQGVELHAYVNVMPAWRGETPPENPEQLYNQHPEWFWYDQNGERQALSSFYVSLNPCLPEVREYIVDVFEDLAARYDIDGLHLDYIRFPNEPPATPRGSGLDYPRDEKTLALYKEATGLTPDEDKAAWNAWRTAQVTELVGEIHKMLRRTRPTAALSASVGSIRERGLSHFQDGRTWIDNGFIDIVILMNYTDEPKVFAERIAPWLDADAKAPIVPGLWFGRHPEQTTEEAVADVAEEIEIARAMTGDFCVFAYSSLFDSSDEELAKQNEKQKNLRAKRREILLPLLREMKQADNN